MNKNILTDDSYIIDQLRERPIPEYDKYMWMQGYKPYEILEASDKTIPHLLEEHKKEDQDKASEIPKKINIDVKVQKK